MAHSKTNWELAGELLASIDLSHKPLLTRLHDKFFGRTASLSGIIEAEEKALALQIRMAQDFIQLRRDASLRQLPKPYWPEGALVPQSPSKESHSVSESLLALLKEIQEATIPPNAKEDMIADYWNKWAFVTWERAVLEEDVSARSRWLAYVDRYLGLISRDPGRVSWTPWQMNKVRFLLAQSLTQADAKGLQQDAQSMLNRILGIIPVVAMLPTPADPVQIADTIAKMATEPDASAIGSDLRRSYPGLSGESIRQIKKLLAGKIRSALLNRIFLQYKAASPSTPSEAKPSPHV